MSHTTPPPAPSTGARLLAAVCAVLGPVLVFLVFGWWLTRVRDVSEMQAAENAGLVFNGQVRAGGAVAAMNGVLARQPDVVLIGPSYANTDLRRDLIAKHLGVAPGKVALLSIPNSVGAHWYAVLKYRVFGQGVRPRAVVVVSGLQSMLLTAPLTEASWVNLRVQLDDPQDPVVTAKARQQAWQWLGRVRELRGTARDRVVGTIRELPPRLLLPSSVRSGGMGPIEVRERLGSVFDDANVSMALHAQRTTSIVTEPETRTYDLSVLTPPEDGFMVDIGELCAQHGARLVWVRPPMSPNIPADLDDVAPDGFQERAAAVAARTGASFLDMRRLPMTDLMFRNVDHMNEEGSVRFSEALGKALAELHALELEPVPGTPPFPPARVVVDGAPGELPAAEAAWAGPGTWVGPGQSLRATFDQAWTRERGPFVVKVAAEQLGPLGAAPRVVVAGQPMRLAAADATAGWRLWRSEAALQPPDGAFEAVVTVPEGGAWLRVTGLALGARAARTHVVGDATGVDGASARLLGVEPVIAPVWPDAPGPVPMAFDVVDEPGRIARFDTPKWDFLSDEHLMGQSAFGSRCSPLRVTEDGAPLPLPNEPCADVERQGRGRTCHTPDAVRFTAGDGSDPARNGRKYKMILDPQRRCDLAVWLYPKDRFVATWPAAQLAGFARGATHFTLAARYLQKRKAEIRVILRVDGEVRVDETLDGRVLYDGPKVWRLDPPLPPDARDVTVEVENLEYTFYLFEELALSEGPLPVLDARWVR